MKPLKPSIREKKRYLLVKGFIRSYIEKTKSFIAENESIVA